MVMYRLLSAVLLTLSVASTSAAAPDIAAIDRGRILKAVDAALTLEPLTITAYRAELSEGGPNDFYSRACPRTRESMKHNALASEKSGHGSPNRLPCPKFGVYRLFRPLIESPCVKN